MYYAERYISYLFIYCNKYTQTPCFGIHVLGKIDYFITLLRKKLFQPSLFLYMLSTFIIEVNYSRPDRTLLIATNYNALNNKNSYKCTIAIPKPWKRPRSMSGMADTYIKVLYNTSELMEKQIN